MLKFVLVYIPAINLLTFYIFGIDKWKAKKERWRISEKCLLTFALLGGSLGALLGMKVFHHKTKKPLFYISVPLFLILHTAIIVFAVYRLYI